MKRNFFILLSMFCCIIASSQTRFMVMSDMHVMDKSLFNEGSAFETYRQNEAKLVEHSAELFDKAISMIMEEKPELLLIPGDLSKDGEKVSHEYVASRLNTLVSSGIKVLVVPGNHDIGNPYSYSYLGDTKEKVANITSDEFKMLYSSCGYSDAVATNGLSYMSYPNDRLAVICLDSRKPDTSTRHYSEGGLTEATLSWAETVAAQARQQGRIVIGMMHHPAMEHFDGHAELATNYVANQSSGYPSLSSMQERLVNAGIGMMFTGHYHLQSIQHEATSHGELWDVMTGSLSSYPMPLRKGTISGSGAITISSLHVGDYQTLGKQRNQNTTVSLFKSLSNKMAAKFEPYADILSKMGIATTAEEIEPIMKSCMLSEYTALVNAMSAGDEEKNSPETGLKGCVDSYDKFLKTLFGSTYYIVYALMKAQMDDYKAKMQMMCKSVFYNYKGEESNVVADNDNTVYALPPVFNLTAHEDPANMGRFYVSFFSCAANYRVPEGVTAYKGVASDGVLHLFPLDNVIAKGEAVVLKADRKAFSLTSTDEDVLLSSDNDLLGTDDNITNPGGTYVLTLGQRGVGFYQYKGELLNANRAYLMEGTITSAPENVYVFDFGNGETTRIDIVKPHDDKDTPIYSLSGQRLCRLANGVNISGGKKVVIK